MNLLWLCLGIGLGWLASFLWRRSPSRPPSEPGVASATRAEVTQLQQQLQQTELAYYMALEMSQLKGNFLARTSHELRSPMNGIIGMHQLILADLSDSPEEEREFIAQANASALKMIKVLDEVIDAAKVEQGTYDLDLQPVSLRTLLQEVNNLTHLQAQNRNLQFTIATPPEQEYVLADPRRLRQVLVSLVDAAIAQLTEGRLSVQAVWVADAPMCKIQIDAPIAAQVWLHDSTQPPTQMQNHQMATLDRATILQLANQPFPNPGFVFAVARSLVESMQGQLDVIVRTDHTQDRSQICCTIPRIPADASID
ncbi:MAG: histidine kinase dimerization/phospho-acceptor domain-containing protein [Leptolyngbyaceae cyanobacterium bins.349]|nr:histidine kinase dimerization/phospho-acceptor domain-containing protein [Leptolyngbyaceae cyanobacterium bins.349]